VKEENAKVLLTTATVPQTNALQDSTAVQSMFVKLAQRDVLAAKILQNAISAYPNSILPMVLAQPTLMLTATIWELMVASSALLAIMLILKSARPALVDALHAALLIPALKEDVESENTGILLQNLAQLVLQTA